MSIDLDRRQFVQQGTIGLTGMAIASSLAESASATGNTGSARSVIFLYMSGGPSQVDTFDPKPALKQFSGQDVPGSIAKTIPPIKRSGLKNILPSHWEFQRHGQSAIPVSSLLPHTARHVDELCVIRSVQHQNPVHGPGAGEFVSLTGVRGSRRK